ncbi:MAG: branched-chain amino acid ABC transporter permease [Actinomycetota bacterium]|nr:branched-chain amino acid ABC transporter permease [Actinomycetota bacterium]
MTGLAGRERPDTRRAPGLVARLLPAAVPAASRGRRGRLVLAVAGVLLALLPFAGVRIGWILPGPVDVLNSAGTMQVLGLCFIFAAVALGFDLLYGFTGLLSLGQVLYFAVGCYVFDIALSQWHWALIPALALTMAVSLALAVVLGAICLRVSGIAFAMVTLAFAQAVYYLIQDDPHGLTGGATGLVLSTARVPAALAGVASTQNLYWLALVFLAVVYLIVWAATESAAGRVWLAIRDSQRRVEVLGLRPLPFKLASFVLSSLIAAAGGVVYVLLVGTAAPDAVASTAVTISVLVMVVLGGAGTRWGAVAGAMVYVYLQQYLLKVAAEPSFAALPAPLRVPLSQPDFLLGAVFVLFVLFAPGGIAGLASRIGVGSRS